MPLIGRIDVTEFPGSDFVGTGWFVDNDIVALCNESGVFPPTSWSPCNFWLPQFVFFTPRLR
jgi:hypothetical protein